MRKEKVEGSKIERLIERNMGNVKSDGVRKRKDIIRERKETKMETYRKNDKKIKVKEDKEEKE